MRGCVWRLGRTVRAHAHGWLPSALQSRRWVYPVGVTDGSLLSRVTSKLTLLHLSCSFAICLFLSFLFFCFFSRVPHHGMFCLELGTVSRQDGFRGSFHLEGVLLIDHQELTTIRGPSDDWAYSATISDEFVPVGRSRYLPSPYDPCPRQT